MTAPALDEVVAAAYEAAAGVRPWSDACGVLCAAMDLWCVQILGLFKSTGAIAFSFEGGQLSPEAALQFVAHYHAINPRFGLGPLLRDGNWVHDREHLDDDFVARDPFYQDYLIPFGGRYASATKLIDDDDLLVLLTLHRGVGKSPLDDARVAEVDRIRGHLERALRIHLRRQSSRPMSVAGHALLEVLPQGVIVVDETRRITYSNPAARELLGRGGPLVDRDGRLDGADLRGSRELLASIHSLGLGGALVSTGGSDRALLRLSGAGRAVELLVFAIAVRPSATMRVFGDDPCAILIVHPLDATARLDPLIVSLAFNLTPAEARVATAIAEGASPEEVATHRGVSLATVRTQLRCIFEKLGVRRQPDMVRMLLELPRLRPATGSARELTAR
jgi:DNA-binding CsgD family transcriptional regulator/PAS domain-containing protein